MTTARKAPITRDPAKTRARILKAAITEFSAKGYSGARTEQIVKRARSNIRMLYHYFGSKEALYLQVLEAVLGELRQKELQLDFDAATPMDGILQMFDFIDGHFAAQPELRALLAYENLNRAQHMKRSERIREMASPVIVLIGKLLARGVADGSFREGIDPLRLYVAMVSLAYYAKAHAPTLSRIFDTDLAAPDWQAAQKAQTQQMLASWLAVPAASRPAPSPSPSPKKTRR